MFGFYYNITLKRKYTEKGAEQTEEYCPSERVLAYKCYPISERHLPREKRKNEFYFYITN